MSSPSGVRLGGAFFELTANAAPMIAAMAQAEARAKATNQAIAQATGVPEKAVQRLGATYIREQKRMSDASAQATLRIIKASNDQAAAADRAAKAQAQAAKQAESSLLSLGKAGVGVGVGLLGVSSAADVASKAIAGIVGSTQAAQQAQFALSKTYGTSSAEMTAFAKQFGDAIGRSNTEVLRATVIVGNLTKEYGLNQAQARQLVKMAADLAAVYGKDLPDATERLAAAIRGEAEAAEALGLVLNEDAVATRQLGQENKALWEKLTDSEKAALRLAEATRQLGERQGAAEERAAGSLGAFDRLNKASDELGAALGERLLPVAAAVADVLATMGTGAVEALEAFNDLAKLDFATLERISALLFAPGAVVAARALGIKLPGNISRPRNASVTSPSGQPYGPGLNPGDVNAINEAQVAAIKRKAQVRKALEAADKANDATAESAIKAIDKERKEKERWYDEERDRIQARRTYQLEDIETRRDAAIAALEDEKRAAREALEGQIEEQERLKDARLEAAEAAAEAAKAAIDAEKDRLEIAREAEDRERNDTRRREDQNREGIRRTEDRQIEDARRRQDRAAEEAQESEITRLERLRDARADAIEDDIERFEAASQRKLRALDREADRARANSDKALRELERRGEKEDEQHRKRMQALEDEQDARLGILDAQLKALDAQEKSADAADRIAGIQKRLSDAQKAVTEARGTGTPEQITAARGDLTRAIRSGDPIAEANARERLVQLAGKGNEAIKKADEDLAEAQADLRKEGVDQARDAERDKLKAAQDAIKADIEARKRAEDEENRQRKQSLEREQEAERDKLKSRLDRLERQKQAAQDEAKEEIGRLRDSLEAERQSAQGQIEITRQRFEAAKEVLAQERIAEDRKREDYRREEDRVRAEERLAQDRYRQDERAEQDKALATQLAAVNATLAQERKDTELHFNGPNGTITQLRKAIEDSELLYSRRLAAARAAYEAERKEAERVYTNPEGNGLLQLLEKARQSEFDKLEASKTQWQEWAKAASEAIKAAMADLDTFIARGANIPRINPGGGTSNTNPRPSINGSPVQGPGFDDDNQSPSGSIANPPEEQVIRSIYNAFGAISREAAEDAIAVWSGEGRSAYVGDQGSSFGPFQLHMGGLAPPGSGNEGSGLGDAFRRETGLDPRDPSTYYQQISWVARYVRANGWNGQWHGAPGHIKHKRYAEGGWIDRPSYLVDARSGRAWGTIAERERELVVPASRMTSAAMMARPSLGPGPAPTNYAAMGAFMSAAHPGGRDGGVGYQDNRTTHIHGAGTEELMAKIRRENHRNLLLQRRPR